MVLTNLNITIIHTTKTGLYKVQIFLIIQGPLHYGGLHVSIVNNKGQH